MARLIRLWGKKIHIQFYIEGLNINNTEQPVQKGNSQTERDIPMRDVKVHYDYYLNVTHMHPSLNVAQSH